MNRTLVALTLAAAVVVSTFGISALAVDGDVGGVTALSEGTVSETVQSEEPSTENAAGDPPASQDIPRQDSGEAATEAEPAVETDENTESSSDSGALGSIRFSDLASRMRENNLTILALEENIAAIESIDYDEMTDDIRDALSDILDQRMALESSTSSGSVLSMDSFAGSAADTQMLAGAVIALQYGMQAIQSSMTSSAIQSLDEAYNSLRSTYDDLKDGKIQQNNADLVRQLRSAQNQIIMAGEALYIALLGLEANGNTVDRSLAALDRTVQEMELRYKLGQISALTLQEIKAGRASLASSQQTLEMNIRTYKIQLELLLGADLTGSIQLQALPQVTADQLAAMALDNDLNRAKDASYDLLAAQRTLEDAEEAFEEADDEYKSKDYQFIAAQHTWKAAQYTYTSEIQNFEVSFRSLYAQVLDYQQILDTARITLACEQDSYAAAQLKYEQGSLSKNKLLDAQDEVAAAQDSVTSAAVNLFSAYNNYRWAVDHGILN